MSKLVVRLGYAAPEIAALIREGPKTLFVVPTYGLTIEQAIADAPNRTTGERWPREQCVLLDPIEDQEKIAAVKEMVRENRDVRATVAKIEKAAREAYKARAAEIFLEVR